MSKRVEILVTEVHLKFSSPSLSYFSVFRNIMLHLKAIFEVYLI